jgi:hypothetical protein
MKLSDETILSLRLLIDHYHTHEAQCADHQPLTATINPYTKQIITTTGVHRHDSTFIEAKTFLLMNFGLRLMLQCWYKKLSKFYQCPVKN